MASKIRTFVAVDIGPQVRQLLDREMPKLLAAAPDFNWVRSENFHFTLSFLGDVRDNELPEICQAIQSAVQSTEEFELETVGIKPFPSVDRIKYLWAGVGFGKEEICALQAAVAAATTKLGFPRDRDIYTPHLTIARARANQALSSDAVKLLLSIENKSFGISSIDEVIVYASYLEKNGPKYVPLSTIHLAY
jgi:2'-5' RNA ligase